MFGFTIFAEIIKNTIMKKIITLLVVALFTLNLSAQKIEKGIWLIEIGTGINTGLNWTTGGSFDYDQTINGTSLSGYPISGDWKDFYNSETELNFDVDATNFQNWEDRFLKGVSFGYFVADGFLIGLGLDLGGFNTGVDDTTQVNKNSEFSLGATPKLRYYVETGRGNAMFFESSFRIGVDNTKLATDYSNGNWNETSNNIFGSTIGLGVGYSIFSFNSREIFAIEPMIGFNINSTSTNNVITSYDKASDIKTVTTEKNKLQSMGAYFKIKIAFYLGRHFWSH